MNKTRTRSKRNTHFVIEEHPVADDLAIVTIRVQSSTRHLKQQLNSLGIEYLEESGPSGGIISFYRKKRLTLDYTKLLGPGAETLVDSTCSYGKRSGTRCRRRTKNEYCVDDGASANRCSDRNDFGCSRTYSSRTPPTC